MALIVVPTSPNPIFDCSRGNVFQTLLTQDATPTVQNVSAGVEYIFIIQQDVIGGWAFNWQANTIDASAVNPAAGSATVQGFVGRSDGNLYPTGPASFN